MARVDAFLERTGVVPATLGRHAVGDPNLVRELRDGRSPTLATVDQVMAFMEAFDQAHVAPVPSRGNPPRSCSPNRTEADHVNWNGAACVHVPIPDGVFVTIDEDPVGKFGTYRRYHQPTCPLGQAPYMVVQTASQTALHTAGTTPYLGQYLSVPHRLLQLLQY